MNHVKMLMPNKRSIIAFIMKWVLGVISECWCRYQIKKNCLGKGVSGSFIWCQTSIYFAVNLHGWYMLIATIISFFMWRVGWRAEAGWKYFGLTSDILRWCLTQQIKRVIHCHVIFTTMHEMSIKLCLPKYLHICVLHYITTATWLLLTQSVPW